MSSIIKELFTILKDELVNIQRNSFNQTHFLNVEKKLKLVALGINFLSVSPGIL